MINLTFILSFSILVICVKRRSNGSTQLGIISAASLATLGLAVPMIWNWSRKYAPLGLLPSHFLSETDKSAFYHLFFLLSLGSLCSGFCFLILQQSTHNKYPKQDLALNFERLRHSKSITVFGALTLFFLIFGLGRSLFLNEGYLTFSGSQTFLRAANALIFPALMALGFACGKSKIGAANWTIFVMIILIQAGRGSRVILIVPLLLALLFFRRSHSYLRNIFNLIFLSFLTLVLMDLTFSARSTRSGIFMLPSNFVSSFKNNLVLDNFIPALGRMLASLTSWAPTVIASIPESSASLILKNLNPLIGSGSDALSYSSEGLERLFPYTWIPLSSLGQIYGAFGGFVLVLTMFTISSIASLSLYQGRSSGTLSVYSLLATSTYLCQFPLFFQYSSRIWLRVLWLMALLTILHLSTLNGKRYRDSQKELV